MSDHPTTLTEAERDRLDGSLANSGCHGFLGDHPDLYAVAEKIKADAYAAGLAARTPTATGDMQGLTEKAARPGGLPDDPTPWPSTPGFGATTATGDTAGESRKAFVQLSEEWDLTEFPDERTAMILRADLHRALDSDAARILAARTSPATPAATGVTAGDDLRDRVTALADECGSSACIHLNDMWGRLHAVLAASPAPVVSRPEATDEDER